MSESILTIIIVAIISLGVFGFIKLVCKPIKTVTVILLVIPTAATCGIALLVYKFFRNTFEVSSYSVKSFSSNPSPTTFYDESSHTEVKKSKNKKPTSSFTDVSGNTTYYDEEGDFISKLAMSYKETKEVLKLEQSITSYLDKCFSNITKKLTKHFETSSLKSLLEQNNSNISYYSATAMPESDYANLLNEIEQNKDSLVE